MEAIALTEGIRISVEPFYQPDYSNPIRMEFMFSYRITIANKNKFPVQILARHWDIFDSKGSRRIIDGEGVLGAHPVIQQEEEFQYVSGCNLQSEIGTMAGYYTMQNLDTKGIIEVVIPIFDLIAPFKLN